MPQSEARRVLGRSDLGEGAACDVWWAYPGTCVGCSSQLPVTVPFVLCPDHVVPVTPSSRRFLVTSHMSCDATVCAAFHRTSRRSGFVCVLHVVLCLTCILNTLPLFVVTAEFGSVMHNVSCFSLKCMHVLCKMFSVLLLPYPRCDVNVVVYD